MRSLILVPLVLLCLIFSVPQAGATKLDPVYPCSTVQQCRNELARKDGAISWLKKIRIEDSQAPVSNVQIGRILAEERGFNAAEQACLIQLWSAESGWKEYAHNRSSGAHGIPQALPGSKMASAGPDWATNPVTQIEWGLGYIIARYRTPCGAYNLWRGHSPHWY